MHLHSLHFASPFFLGERWDKRDLIDEWKKEHPKGKFVYTRDQLLNVDTANLQDQLLGRNKRKVFV